MPKSSVKFLGTGLFWLSNPQGIPANSLRGKTLICALASMYYSIFDLDWDSQCANNFGHLEFLPKIATNHTANLVNGHTDTWLSKLSKTEKWNKTRLGYTPKIAINVTKWGFLSFFMSEYFYLISVTWPVYKWCNWILVKFSDSDTKLRNTRLLIKRNVIK